MSYEDFGCTGSVTGYHDEGSRRDGRCTWCEKRFRSPAPKPDHFEVSELTEAYGEMWDPDWDGVRPRRTIIGRDEI